MTISQLNIDRCYDDDNSLFDIKSEVCDQRRIKRYGRNLTVTFRLQLTNYAYGRTMPFVNEIELKNALLQASLLGNASTADSQVGRVHMSSFRSSLEAPTVGTSYNSVEVLFSAEKPSLILSEEACLALIGGGRNLIEVVQACVDAENKRHTEAQHRERVAEYATWVAQTVAEALHKEARKRCCYDARLAGLNAEYASHMTDLSKDELEGILEGMDFELQGLDQDEVYTAAMAHLDKFLTKKTGHSSFQGRGHSVKISSADLDPARDG